MDGTLHRCFHGAETASSSPFSSKFQNFFILDTDASDQAIGSVLSQNVDSKEHAVAYASRTLTKPL